jgi:hypothetical protein
MVSKNWKVALALVVFLATGILYGLEAAGELSEGASLEGQWKLGICGRIQNPTTMERSFLKLCQILPRSDEPVCLHEYP